MTFTNFAVPINALTPSYSVTDTYKKSIFYKRLESLKFTGDERRDIVNIAITQLGYHEGNGKSDFDGMNYGGSSNYVEYNYANKKIYSNNNTYSYAWCASFVTWCARQAGIETATVTNSVSCDYFVSDFKSKSRYKTRASGYSPIAGDLIFFKAPDANRTYASHVGIVVGTDSSYVYTIEGNTSRGLVNARKYSLNNSTIVGYGVPNYKGTLGNYGDFELLSGYVEPGIYTVNSSVSLNIRSGPATSYSKLGEIPNGTKIEASEASGDFAKITYNGITGWVSLKYLRLTECYTYEIVYDAGESLVSPLPTKKQFGVATNITDEVPSRKGYLFLGWSKTKNATEPDYFSGDSYESDSSITLYAVWRPASVTVEFFDDDGRLIDKKDYKYGDNITVPNDPDGKVMDGIIYVFESWDKEIDTVATENKRYTAVYKIVNIEEITDTDKPFDTQQQITTTAPYAFQTQLDETTNRDVNKNKSDKSSIAFNIVLVLISVSFTGAVIVGKRNQ